MIVAGFVLTVCLAATQKGDSKFNLTDNIEIPAKIEGRNEQIITHIGYTVSYNSDWKTPNWVAYQLTKEEVEGIIRRSGAFLPDPEVPYENSATTYDYTNSGWDRGHMAPAGDMKWSEQAMKESFYLSNICPQNKNLNSGIWSSLEVQVRELARKNGEIYVVCGPIMSKQPQTIGTSKVAVPDAFFKVLLQSDSSSWHAIAFMFANKSGRNPLATYAMSVENIQIITDIDFFPALPDSIEQKVESEVDFTKWNISLDK
ncbi:MAG: DNA/RNA non-specific endonuclease [Prevotellaceae bacterium]|nr:DNA/RNA non-specific endonuclease [Prevotellaceae bacterium]